ncbi:flagellar radial spoke protein [Thraustotheca clavata]|uniref:Flagellar radial spoke protein n=1 Tax=Thraustotheca clavata TaxID=74557 RepID=A0A1V9ZPF4_9STRA|nr:flagellar radial spoke protein [Thraustotheca clavata]
MSNLTIDEAKAYLRQTVGGVNLYDHLSEVLLKLLVERPNDAVNAFEHLSCTVRQERFKRPNEANNPESATEIEAKAQQEAWGQAAVGLLKIQNGEEEVAPETPSGVADILDEANMFEWAGIGFSRGETFRLSLALQKLATVNATVKLRFWGKILGLGMDYYVAEGELQEPYEPEDLEAEEGANGLNKNTFWVMKDNGKYEWVQLPNVRRDQVIAARGLRRFVRDNLDGKVHGHPPFPGTEKNFLRAQIARISSSTVLCPGGYFTLTEEGNIEPPEEAPEAKTTAELAELGNWVHYTREINERYGRTIAMPPKTKDDGEEEPWEGEDLIEPLRALSEDKPNSWRVERLPNTVSAAVGEIAVVRSLIWPGAVSLGVGKKFLNVYVGHCLKAKFGQDHQLQVPKPLQPDYGISSEGDTDPKLKFTNLMEQLDILVDPSPPEESEA